MIQQNFTLPASYKKWQWGLIIVGIVAILYGLFFLDGFKAAPHHDAADAHAAAGDHGNQSTRFWAVMLQNSVYWLLVVNSAMFFLCATTLAMGGFQVAFRRVTEAITSVVPVLGIICFAVLMAIVWGGRTDIYHWLDKDAVAHDAILSGKKGFLNPVFFTVWTAITIGLWIVLGRKMRSLSLWTDEHGPLDFETAKKWTWDNTVWGSVFLVVFGLTVASTIPWLWIMSIDSHWYSTMFSWYTFISSFVPAMSLIAIYAIYLKKQGVLEIVNDEHIHDIGKFMFAFSVFWTYLWFSQYMLIWYSNQPEETRYFIHRIGTAEKPGMYTGVFFLNLILSFLCPLLVLMTKGSKRNWNLLTFMALLLIFGHWLDFYQMVMPGTVREGAELLFFEYGVPCLFIGVIMWGAGKYLESHNLEPMNHPFMKESIIHHT